MIKSILVPLLGDESDVSVLDYARSVAGQFHAHIDAMHISRNPVDEVLRLVIGDSVITQELWQSIESEIAERLENARSRFKTFCDSRAVQVLETPRSTSGVTACWHLVEGDPAMAVSLKGRFSELIVLDRGDGETGFTPSALGDILIRSGRPVLISTRGRAVPRTFETVALAWKDTLEAAHMMTAAMPLFEAAARVIILTAPEGDDTAAEADGAEQLAAELRWHGIEPEVLRLRASGHSTGEALIDAAAKAGADLLALGGYGHSRAREFVFGGVTRYMLESARFPVLMVH